MRRALVLALTLALPGCGDPEASPDGPVAVDATGKDPTRDGREPATAAPPPPEDTSRPVLATARAHDPEEGDPAIDPEERDRLRRLEAENADERGRLLDEAEVRAFERERDGAERGRAEDDHGRLVRRLERLRAEQARTRDEAAQGRAGVAEERAGAALAEARAAAGGAAAPAAAVLREARRAAAQARARAQAARDRARRARDEAAALLRLHEALAKRGPVPPATTADAERRARWAGDLELLADQADAEALWRAEAERGLAPP